MGAHAGLEGCKPVAAGGGNCHSIPDGRNRNAAPEREPTAQVLLQISH